jgi:cell envelope opacity-associated protein A
MIEGGQPTREGVITSEPEEDVQPSQKPMEQAAEALAYELLKKLLLAPVAVTTAKLPRVLQDAVAPLTMEPCSQPETGICGKRKHCGNIAKSARYVEGNERRRKI